MRMWQEIGECKVQPLWRIRPVCSTSWVRVPHTPSGVKCGLKFTVLPSRCNHNGHSKAQTAPCVEEHLILCSVISSGASDIVAGSQPILVLRYSEILKDRSQWHDKGCRTFRVGRNSVRGLSGQILSRQRWEHCELRHLKDFSKVTWLIKDGAGIRTKISSHLIKSLSTICYFKF